MFTRLLASIRSRSVRYWASLVVPVPMAATYGILDDGEDGPCRWVRDAWWQWRNRTYRHRTSPVGV